MECLPQVSDLTFCRQSFVGNDFTVAFGPFPLGHHRLLPEDQNTQTKTQPESLSFSGV